MSSPPPQPRRATIPIGVEVTDAGTRLSGLVRWNSTSHPLRERRELPLSPDEAHSAIGNLALRALREANATDGDQPSKISLCVAISGRVDRASGAVIQADGLPGWAALGLGEQLRQRFSYVVVESVVNAAALAEAWTGAGKARASMLYISLNRRVSAAYVVEGSVLRGAHERAGQLGHWRLSMDGPRCVCGAQGHLDPVASAQSIVRNMIGLASGSEESHEAMLRVAHGRVEAMSAAHVLELAEAGDPLAQAVTNAAIDGLSVVIGNLIAALDPAVIVLDGPFAGKMDALLDLVRSRVHGMTDTYAEPVAIVASLHGPLGALEGARLIAEREAMDRQSYGA